MDCLAAVLIDEVINFCWICRKLREEIFVRKMVLETHKCDIYGRGNVCPLRSRFDISKYDPVPK